jgi:hypothetical protein
MPIANCNQMQSTFNCWCFAIAVPSTSLLFFLRIKAIFANTRVIVYFFFAVWLGVLGASIVIPIGMVGAHIAFSDRSCIDSVAAEYGGPATAINMVHGTLVFVAITCKLLSFNHATSESRISVFFGTKGSSQTAAGLLHSGQLYYL